MTLTIDPAGNVRCLYTEDIPLGTLGRLSIARASHVEPGECGTWYADLSPVNGPMLGPFPTRSAALAAEVRWLERNYL